LVWGQLALAGIPILSGAYALSLHNAQEKIQAGLFPPSYIRPSRYKVSVLIPAYNEVDYIARIISSAWNQTEPVNEIIVADASDPSEGTREIAQKLGATVVPAIYGNVSQSRNLAAKESSGELLIFADADMCFPNGLVESLVDTLEKGFLVAHPRYMVDDTRAWQMVTWPIYAFRARSLTGGCIAVSRGTFNEVGGYDERCSPTANWCREDLKFGRDIALIHGGQSLKVTKDVVGISGRRYKVVISQPDFEPVRAIW